MVTTGYIDQKRQQNPSSYSDNYYNQSIHDLKTDEEIVMTQLLLMQTYVASLSGTTCLSFKGLF